MLDVHAGQLTRKFHGLGIDRRQLDFASDVFADQLLGSCHRISSRRAVGPTPLTRFLGTDGSSCAQQLIGPFDPDEAR